MTHLITRRALSKCVVVVTLFEAPREKSLKHITPLPPVMEIYLYSDRSLDLCASESERTETGSQQTENQDLWTNQAFGSDERALCVIIMAAN